MSFICRISERTAMDSNPFQPSTTLSNVKFGLMGYLPLSKEEFDTWRTGDKAGLVGWSDSGQPPSATIREFQIVENFLPNKMLFVGNSDSKGENVPLRGELTKQVPVQCDFGVGPDAEKSTAWSWAAVFVFYEKYDALVILLHTDIPRISVDQLVFLREQVWYPGNTKKSWRLFVESEQKVLDSFHALFNCVLSDARLHSLKIDKDYPLFSLIELRSIGPATEVMNFPSHRDSLTLGEHYGLFSGDEGYRLVNLERGGAGSPINTGYPSSLFDPQYQFSGRKHFAYHFSSTNCICFMAEDVANLKKKWADWYTAQVVEMSTVSEYVGLATNVPCLSDGIPIMVEVCMIRYRSLVSIERELRQAFDRPTWERIRIRFKARTALDLAQRRVEQLDLYQDNALWIIGGPHTDLMFDYAAVRARLDKARQSIQQIESETTRIMMGFAGLALAIAFGVASLAFGAVNVMKILRDFGFFSQPANPLSPPHNLAIPGTTPTLSAAPIAPLPPSSSANSSRKGK